MALTKEVLVDQITVLEDGQMQIREVTKIFEDGVELSKSYHRHVKSPTDDMTNEVERVKKIAAAIHTKAVKDVFKANQTS